MVKKGSSIELNCTVESGDRAYNSLAVFWYLNHRAIDWQGQTGPGKGVEVSPRVLSGCCRMPGMACSLILDWRNIYVAVNLYENIRNS